MGCIAIGRNIKKIYGSLFQRTSVKPFVVYSISVITISIIIITTISGRLVVIAVTALSTWRQVIYVTGIPTYVLSPLT